jgi:UDP-N-acetylmuramate-alanine ligase
MPKWIVPNCSGAGAGLKIYSFPEYIYQERKDKKRIVVGGSHGKTSTTAMIMHVISFKGQPFDYLPAPGWQASSDPYR